LHAAVEQRLGARLDGGERAVAGRLVDTGDEQALAAALGEQSEGVRDALGPAGEGDDAIRPGVEMRLAPLPPPPHAPPASRPGPPAKRVTWEAGPAAARTSGASTSRPSRRRTRPVGRWSGPCAPLPAVSSLTMADDALSLHHSTITGRGLGQGAVLPRFAGRRC